MKHISYTFPVRYPRALLTHFRRKTENLMNRPREDATQNTTYGIINQHYELTEHLEALGPHSEDSYNFRQKDWRYLKAKEVRPQQTSWPGVQHSLWWLQQSLHR